MRALIDLSFNVPDSRSHIPTFKRFSPVFVPHAANNDQATCNSSSVVVNIFGHFGRTSAGLRVQHAYYKKERGRRNHRVDASEMHRKTTFPLTLIALAASSVNGQGAVWSQCERLDRFTNFYVD
jgi:hypothetical protein